MRNINLIPDGRRSRAKVLKVHCPALRLRGGLTAPKTTLRVHYWERTVGLPWAEIRPLIACAFRHIQREAFRDLKHDFIRRMNCYQPILFLAKGRNWWGRCVGIHSRVFIGKLHTEPRQSVYPKYKDMPVFWHKDWKETLVGLTAHELWHRWQPGWGKKAEIMCELVESDAIEAYRREQGYAFTPTETTTTTE